MTHILPYALSFASDKPHDPFFRSGCFDRSNSAPRELPTITCTRAHFGVFAPNFAVGFDLDDRSFAVLARADSMRYANKLLLKLEAPETLELLPRCDRLETFTLLNNANDAEVLRDSFTSTLAEVLPQLPFLRVLNLSGVPSSSSPSSADDAGDDEGNVISSCRNRPTIPNASHITAMAVAGLSGNTRLTDIDLSACYITDRSLKLISHLPYLKHLRLARNDVVTSTGLAHLSGTDHADKLLSLTLGRSHGGSNKAFDMLRDISLFPNLRRLHLWTGRLSSDDIKGLAKCKQLRELVLEGVEIGHGADMAAFASSVPSGLSELWRLEIRNPTQSRFEELCATLKDFSSTVQELVVESSYLSPAQAGAMLEMPALRKFTIRTIDSEEAESLVDALSGYARAILLAASNDAIAAAASLKSLEVFKVNMVQHFDSRAMIQYSAADIAVILKGNDP